MKIQQLCTLGAQHLKNSFAENLYIHSGIDKTKPISFHALVTEHCNAKCKHCDHWRRKYYCEELDIDQWKNMLLSIKSFVGSYAINFSGGEPLVKKGFHELLQFCSEHDIHAGLTTNGAFLENQIDQILCSKPFNVNISLDSHIGEVHDNFRGVDKLFDKASEAIECLIQERQASGLSFPIIIKPTVMAFNFQELPQFVEWAQNIGVTAVNFQPLGRWTEETYNELWIEEDNLPKLEAVIDRLIEMKRAGAPILNSEASLKLIPASFREEKADPSSLPCRVGLQEFYIRPNGDVHLCMHFPSIGNLAIESAQDIWYGQKAKKIRNDTIKCEKLCLLTCLSHKTIGQKVVQAIRLLQN